MIKPTDFSQCLVEYLTQHLPWKRKLSEDTIKSYQDTFRLLLTFFEEVRNCPAEKIVLKMLDVSAVEDFLLWLENKRGNSDSTVNQRRAAIRAFFKFVLKQKPEFIFQCQQVLTVEGRKQQKAVVNYLSENILQDLLARPDQSSVHGLRDAALLCLLYDIGARVQELIDLSVHDVRLLYPATIRLTGKGRKARIVPVLPQTAAVLKNYMLQNSMDAKVAVDQALFVNRQGNRFTRPGITYILNKYMKEVYSDGLTHETTTITPHVLRHTKAMHLLRANITLPYIRDFLGHVDISTTEVYAKADTEMKRKAFEKAEINCVPAAGTSWQKNQDTLAWLMSLSKK